MTKMKHCPVKGCLHGWKTQEGLVGHLMQHHLKYDVVKALVDLVFKDEA